MGSKAKDGGELTMHHFLPRKKKPKKVQASMESMILFAELATWAWGGKDLRKRGK